MKKFLAIILTITMAFLCCGNTFAATGDMSSWFKNSTAQDLQIMRVNENISAYDTRINTLMTLYGIYDIMGEAYVDLSNVEAPFTDIGNYQPYSRERKAVTWLYLKGVVKGYEDNTIRGNKEITRAEYTAFLIRMLEKTNSSIRVSMNASNPYSDIDGHWAFDDILKATAIGLVQGDGETFRPNSWISKEEVIAIGVRLADKLELDLNEYADIIDDIYDIEISYPIYTDGVWGQYNYSQYDEIIKIDDYKNVYFDGISNISSYTTSKTGIVNVTKYSSYLKLTGKNEGVVTVTVKGSNGYQQSKKILVVDRYSTGMNSDYNYTVRVGGNSKIYAPSRSNIKSYSVTSGSTYINVTNKTTYLSVEGKKEGTANIKITDTYGNTETVTLTISNTRYGSEDYQVEKGDSVRIYPTSGGNVSSYSVTSGSSYVSVTKKTGYLLVEGKSAGSSSIRMTDTYGNVETFSIYVGSSNNYRGNPTSYGVTNTYYIAIDEYESIYFEYIDYIDDYDVSKTGIVTISKNNRYLRINGLSAGTVTITGYDEYGNSEKVKVEVSHYNSGRSDTEYGITNTYSLNMYEEERISFDYIRYIDDYEVSRDNVVEIRKYDSYIKVTPVSTGTVTITVYDEYGNSEKVKVTVYSGNSSGGSGNGSQPPERDVIYAPNRVRDIS